MCMRTLCPRASPSARVPEPRRGAGRWMMRPARCLALPEGVTLKRPGRWRSRTGAVVMAVQGGRHHPLPGLSGREGAGGREAEPDPLLHPPEGHARGKGEVWGERGRIGDWRLEIGSNPSPGFVASDFRQNRSRSETRNSPPFLSGHFRRMGGKPCLRVTTHDGPEMAVRIDFSLRIPLAKKIPQSYAGGYA